MSNEKLPPHNIEAEQAVLGSLLIDPDAIVVVASALSPDDFYDERAQWVYDGCLSLWNRNEAINQITVAEELARKGRLEEVGGVTYLSQAVSVVPTSIHIEYYAQIVHRLAVMRRLIGAAGQIAALAYEADPEMDAVLNKAESILFRLRHGETSRGFIHIRQLLEQYFEEGGPVAPREGHPAHLFTGFTRLDQFLGGLQRSDMIVLGARTSLGKSSLALNIARNAAVEQGAHVAVFSLEMGKEQLVERLLASEANVDSTRIRLGNCSPDEEGRIWDAGGKLAGEQIYVDDSPVLRMVELRSKALRLASEKGIDLIVVDYLQLIRGSNGRAENRVQEISEISRSLKGLARELNVPLIAVSQLSRAVEARPSRIPQLSDLRESGSIEQDADVVLLIYRDDFYYTREQWERQHPDQPYPLGRADIIIAKHRNGPTGTINLEFVRKLTKFKDYTEEEKDEQIIPRLSI